MSDLLNLKDLKLEIKDKVAWITLDRPEASNAYSNAMISSFVKVLRSFQEVFSPVSVVVITGNGKAFSAGGDIKAMKDKTGMFEGDPSTLKMRYQQGIQQISLEMEKLQIPTIAMINGAAIGAGLDLACMCDLRIASDKAKFGSTFAKLGLVPGDGGTFFLPRVVGFPKAVEMILTARIYTASAAQEMGLVHEVTGSGSLEQKTLSLIQEIKKCSPLALQYSKRALKQSYIQELQRSLELLSSYQGIVQNHHEHHEALNAFLEKRDPSF